MSDTDGILKKKHTPKRWQFVKIVNSTPVSILLYFIIIGALVNAILVGSEAMGYSWQWYRVPQFLFRATENGFETRELIWGLWATLGLSTISFIIATILGLVIAMLRLSDLIIGSAVASIFLEIIRNTPLLVLLYLFYYVLGPIFGFDRYVASILCLAVYHAALISEIFRAGITSVPQGQWEAAKSIGMSTGQAYRIIIIPQSIRFMLPPLTGEVVHLIKSSAIVSVIAVAELTTFGRNIISDTYMSFEIWFTVAAIYMAVTLCLSIFVNWLENRFEN